MLHTFQKNFNSSELNFTDDNDYDADVDDDNIDGLYCEDDDDGKYNDCRRRPAF